MTVKRRNIPKGMDVTHDRIHCRSIVGHWYLYLVLELTTSGNAHFLSQGATHLCTGTTKMVTVIIMVTKDTTWLTWNLKSAKSIWYGSSWKMEEKISCFFWIATQSIDPQIL